jgi:cytochrome c peroxidase
MKTSLTMLTIILSLVGCGQNKAEEIQSQEPWAEAQAGVDASPYLVVQVEPGQTPKVLKSHIEFTGSDENAAVYEETQFTANKNPLVVVTEADDTKDDYSTESYHHGPKGRSCYSSQSYRSCQPEYRKNRHRVVYRYSGRLYHKATQRTYIRYKRDTLNYYHDNGGSYQGYRSYHYRDQPESYQQYGSNYNYEQLSPYTNDLAFLTDPTFPSDKKGVAALGRQLFNDKSLSKNGTVSCGTCHQASKNFSDGLKQGEGLGKVNRRTPSIVNVSGLNNLFWDGRAADLKEQAKTPIEASLEHGISRGHVASVILNNYRSRYEDFYGPFPEALASWLQSRDDPGAMPGGATADVSDVSGFIWATIGTRSIKRQITAGAITAGSDREDYINSLQWTANNDNQDWLYAYNKMSSQERNQVNEVFDNFADAISWFEKGIVAFESPFDKFARGLSETGSVREALAGVKNFGERELIGLNLFTGKAGCYSCHNTRYFTDQKYHNIGLPQFVGTLDVGRAGAMSIGSGGRQQAVGAFKTATLRNIGQSQAYMHDGGTSSIWDVLQHYNTLRADPAVGRRDSQLKPLNMEPGELRYIEAFIRSLHSGIRDLSR